MRVPQHNQLDDDQPFAFALFTPRRQCRVRLRNRRLPVVSQSVSRSETVGGGIRWVGVMELKLDPRTGSFSRTPPSVHELRRGIELLAAWTFRAS